ncbi:MAG: TrkH family potassium uptake protein [Candidatus Cohnella colombiensis]|uniref:TrkH family potassium uptake protein n=1 Tax=Candidatus Cohnella colombiensis TaxID=3121368 RepID=A0AA95ETY9_9BACL|nr:MAG: TrkH family potassium uptake protein [Cohnella sp.]
MLRRAARSFVSSPPQILMLGFFVIILLGSCLLMLPFAHVAEKPPHVIDALFTAASATSVTGLAVVDTGTYWTTAGQVIILVMIQIGGLGFMTVATLFAIFLKRKISLREKLVLQQALNQTSMEGIVRLVRRVLLYAFVIEGVGAALFSIRFMFDMPLGTAIYRGVFHSISLFNNAGFDIMGNYRSLVDYVGDPVINIVAMLLIILGGLGFVVLADLVDWRKPHWKLSLHSKVVLTTTGLLIVGGAVFILLLEYTNEATLGSLNFGEKLLASFMQSVSPRTAGVNSIDIGSLRQATQLIIIVLMFIGTSPGSTGGGIKTTTFAVLIGSFITMLRGKEDVIFFRRRLADERVYKALTITLLSFTLVTLATMILSTTEDHHFLMLLFEVTSAFGTVGLTTGLTVQLTFAGKIIIIFLMFIGRVGVLTLTFTVGSKQEKVLHREAEGKIILG